MKIIKTLITFLFIPPFPLLDFALHYYSFAVIFIDITPFTMCAVFLYVPKYH